MKSFGCWAIGCGVLSCAVAACGGKPEVVAAVSGAVSPAWVFCAPENRICGFPGTRQVRYGANGVYSQQTASNQVNCSNAVFGDPVPNVVKTCEVLLPRAEAGEWSAAQTWPVLGVHVTLLPSGKVLAYDASNHHLWGESTNPRVWDPLATSFGPELDPYHTTGSELFCTGFELLWDGNLTTSGNQPNVHADSPDRDRNSNRFGFRNSGWSRNADTNSYRYYPSNAVLANGDMVAFSGTDATAPVEVFKFDGSWRALSGAPLTQNFNYYAWGQSLSSGRLFYPGPDSQMRSFDLTANGAVASPGARDALNRNYGSYAMFAPDRFLVTGGVGEVDGGGGTPGGASVASAVVIDAGGLATSVTSTGSMAFARRMHTATILADGQVLVTGGFSGVAAQGQIELQQTMAVHSAELWNPTTNQWRTLSSQNYPRLYHSTALLLPDGRVLTAGGGMPWNFSANQRNGQVFSPPYLFAADGSAAPRPVISYAPDSLGYGHSFKITLGSASNISKVHLIKLGTVTHAQNFGQRLVPLAFSTNGTTLTSMLPGNPNLTPPGYYLLFIVNSAGVPSVGRMVQVQPFSSVRLLSRLNGKSLRVGPDSQNSSSPRIEMFSTDESLEQVFQMVATGDGYFKLISRANGRLVSVPGGSSSNLVALSTAPDTNALSQQWQFSQGRDGYFEIRARHSGKVMDVANYDTADGATVIQQSDNGSTDNQEWQIVPVGYVSLFAVDSGKALSATATSAGQTVQNVNVQGLNQIWSFEPTSGGWSKVVARHNGNVLDAFGATQDNLAPVWQFPANGGTNQDWRLIPNNDGSFRVQVRHSSKFLNVEGHSVQNGTGIIQYEENGGQPNMLWRVVPAIAGQPFSVSAGGGQVVYRAHVGDVGWQPWVSNNQVAGSTSLSKRIEAIEIRGDGVREGLVVQYRAHVANVGWMPWVDQPATAGTVGESRAMEAIEIRLAGERASCTVRYRAYVSSLGWLGWTNEGTTAGTTGQSRPMEALQIRLECS